MLRNRFTPLGLLLLLSAVTTVAIAGPPPGKGKGGGDDGGGNDGGTGTLPSGLTTRYAVHAIPLTGPRYDTDNKPTDVNENQAVVGYYQDDIGRYVGYRYQAGVVETSDQMLDLSDTEIVDVAFIGINNFDAITAYAGKLDGSVQGLLVTPDGAGGWTWTMTEPPYLGCDYYYPRKINDFGDMVGEYRDESGVGFIYAANSGIYSSDELDLYMPPIEIGVGRSDGVSNTRLAVVGSLPDATFDFFSGQSTSLPQEDGLYFQMQIANDGQIVANRNIPKGKNKGDYVEVYQDGQTLVFGPIKGIGDAIAVNSRSGSNEVGDILLENNRRLSIYQQEWGVLELDAMAVFADVDTEIAWFQTDIRAKEMSDRNSTGFPTLAVRVGETHFVLVPFQP